jgi:hypothetical protein
MIDTNETTKPATKSINGAHAAPAAAAAPAKKPRKVTERVPRTDEKIVFDACDNVLKKTTPEIRAKTMRALSALYGAE